MDWRYPSYGRSPGTTKHELVFEYAVIYITLYGCLAQTVGLQYTYRWFGLFCFPLGGAIV